jgi:hypothetical protein
VLADDDAGAIVVFSICDEDVAPAAAEASE